MYIFDETDGTLAHYGVKGMKWGVRKERIKAARASVRSQKKDIKEAYKEGRYKQMLNLQAKLANDPDRVTAIYMTRGEQLVSGLVTSIMTAGAAAPGALAYNWAYGKAVDREGAVSGFRDTSPGADKRRARQRQKARVAQAKGKTDRAATLRAKSQL